MKKMIPWFLLAASGVFNVFFLAGMLTPRRSARERPGPEKRTAYLARKFDLDEAQQRTLLDLEKKSDEDRGRIDSEYQARFERLLDELVKDEPREGALREFVEAESASDRDRLFVEHLRDLMKILRPEQRVEAAEWFVKRALTRGHRRTGGR